jgi:hypothetical protein
MVRARRSLPPLHIYTVAVGHLSVLQASSDRFNVNISFSKNWEHLQNKFVGTGHPDISKL